MNKVVAVLLFGLISSAGYGQIIRDPMKDGTEPGKVYLKWAVDLQHNGRLDVLITEKLSPSGMKERKEDDGDLFNPDESGFTVYIAQKHKSEYIKSTFVRESMGDVTTGIIVDTSRCYVGYIREVKQYGIVTVERQEVSGDWQGGLPVMKEQIYCYIVEGNHMKRTDLTPLLDDAKGSPIYAEYLRDSKRTKVELQEVTP